MNKGRLPTSNTLIVLVHTYVGTFINAIEVSLTRAPMEDASDVVGT